MLANTWESPRAASIGLVFQPTLTLELACILLIYNVTMKLSKCIKYVLHMLFLGSRNPAVSIVILVIATEDDCGTSTVHIKAGVAHTPDTGDVSLGVTAAEDWAV